MKFGLFPFSLILIGCSTFTKMPSPEFAIWSSFKAPTAGDSRIYGTYQAGCLTGAKALPLQGPGYYVVRKSRERYFGHPDMISYLTELGKKNEQKKFPSLMIEDISYPRGGPFFNGHASHQIGLDVDISLLPVHVTPTEADRENWISPSYVQDRKKLISNWSAEQVHLIELAANDLKVNRIFVAPAIKKYFCETEPRAEWLYKLRSWWGHDDHIHVRLNCPTGSLECKSQAALDPKNNSCGTELDWWYSAEADLEAKKQDQDTSLREFPSLPLECESVKLVAP